MTKLCYDCNHFKADPDDMKCRVKGTYVYTPEKAEMQKI